MKLHINDNSSIAEIQKEFNSKFPYLKIELFDKPHKLSEGSRKDSMIPQSKLLKECRKEHINEDLLIDPNMSVIELESIFMKHFGLNVQVFRKSGDIWIETTVTDQWTLKKQNDEAEAYSIASDKLNERN